MSDRIRLVFAEDHPFFRDGLRIALRGMADVIVVGEATDGEAALDLIVTHRPDVAILDITLPSLDGVTVVRRVREAHLPTEVIFLTVHDDEDMFEEALDLDVKGYLLKDCTPTELVRCVRAVAAGQHYTTPPMASYVVSKARRIARFSEQVPGLSRLTPHERAILRLIAQAKSSKDIAAALAIAPKTVDAHRTNICQKLNLHGTHALSRFASRHRSEL